eukprot:6205465-Pleurochrysis_carterae.AAC.1
MAPRGGVVEGVVEVAEEAAEGADDVREETAAGPSGSTCAWARMSEGESARAGAQKGGCARESEEGDPEDSPGRGVGERVRE